MHVTGPLAADEDDELVAAGAAAAAGAVALSELAEADLFTPPWPEHAPRPPCGEVVPSLHMTGPLPEEGEDSEDEVDAAAAGAAAAGAAAPVELAAADLSTPP